MADKGYAFVGKSGNRPVQGLGKPNYEHCVFIVPTAQGERYEFICEALRALRVQAIVDDGVEVPPLEDVDVVLVIIPNNFGERAVFVRSLAIRSNIKVSHAHAGEILERICKDLDI